MAITETRDVTLVLRFRKLVVAVLFSLFIAGVGNLVYLHLCYSSVMPRNPDPANGRTNLITVNHGTVVYVSQRERARFFLAENLMEILGGVAFLSGLGLAVKWRIIPRKRQ
jgi:hypothetical protein